MANGRVSGHMGPNWAILSQMKSGSLKAVVSTFASFYTLSWYKLQLHLHNYWTTPQDNQENPTNCGTKAADVLDKFLADKLNASPLNILV